LGSGEVPSKIAIIGEAPGAREESTGEAFVGAAGRILREGLRKAGIDPRKAFITNAVSCRPPNNKTPTKGEISACKHWLDYQLERVQPKYVLLLGNVPCQAILGKKGITKLRGRPVERDGVTYLPAFHPAALLHDPSKKEFFEADIALFADIVSNRGIDQDEEFNPIEVKDEKTFQKMLDALTGVVSFDLETTCLYPWKWVDPKKGGKNPFYDTPEITAIGFGTEKAQWSIPWDHYETRDIWPAKRRKRMIRQISARLKKCTVVAQNGKFDEVWMMVKHSVTWAIDFDTMLAHYLLDENDRHGLEHLAQMYFGAMPYDVDPTREPWDVVFPYHCKDLLYTRKLYYTFSKKLSREGNVEQVFYEIMMPCVQLFAKAEVNGVYVDHEKFDEAEEYLTGEIKKAKAKLKRYKRGVNWRSPQQVGALFFGKKSEGGLGLSIVEKTRTGAASTSEGVLKRIDHPAARDLLTLRGHNQQLSFFIDGWKPYLHEHLLHPSFKLHGAVTGRPSCEHPNLQQVPRDSRIRSLIIAPPGWELVECDLSQIELRVAAELAHETAMLEMFYSGKDIHWSTAIREIARQGSMADLILGTASTLRGKKVTNYGKAVDILMSEGHREAIKANGEWKEYRKKAKAVNFGFLYGMYPKKFQTYAFDNYGITVTEEQAKESRDAYFGMYKGLIPWHDRQRRYARRHGYVTTLTGRKRRLPDAQIPYDCKERRGAERQAINSPVQGFAAEMNLMAGIQLDSEFPVDVRVIGTIHDAVLFWARQKTIHKTVARMLEIMRRPAIMDKLNIRLRVPIEAEAAIGPWSKGVSLEEYLEKVA
jgi:DNA polymerase-1